MIKNNEIEQQICALESLKSLKNQGFYDRIGYEVTQWQDIENMKKEVIVKNYAIRTWEAERNGEKVFRAYVPCEFKEKNRKLIEAKSLDLLHEKIVADYYASQDNTYLFSQYFTKWLMEYEVAGSSRQNIAYTYKNYIAGTAIDQKRIQHISRREIIDFLKNIPNNHGTSVSLSTLQKVRSIFNNVFQCAYNDQVISSNIAAGINFKKSNKRTSTPKKVNEEIYSADDLKKLVEMTWQLYQKRHSFIYLAVLLDTQLGLRGSELLALRKDDVDFENNELIIQRTIRTYTSLSIGANGQVVKGEHIREVTENGVMKTDASVRKLPLTDGAVQVLKECFRQHELIGCESSYLFPNLSTNMTFEVRYLDKVLKQVCDQAEIDYRPSHKIRKTVLSSLFNSPDLTPTDVQHWAGHSSLNTTLRTYIHAEQTINLRTKASNVLSGAISNIQPCSIL